MKSIVKIISKYFFYGLSIGLIAYIFYSIGFEHIYHVIKNTNLSLAAIAFSIMLLAAIIRIYKFHRLLYTAKITDTIEIFTTSRLGKEVSFAGYFLPLLKKDHRKKTTFHNLIIDRYAEISATLILAFIAACFIKDRGKTEMVLFISIAGALTLFLLLPFSKIPFQEYLLKKFRWLTTILNTVNALQNAIKINRSENIIVIYGLSLLVTALDFIGSYYIFKSCNVEMNIFYIAAIWASSAFISVLAFMIIGSAEISIIYLFEKLTRVGQAIVSATIIISRLTNLAILSLFMAALILIKKRASANLNHTNV